MTAAAGVRRLAAEWRFAANERFRRFAAWGQAVRAAVPVLMTAAVLLAALTAAGPARAGSTFDAVKRKGFVQCGVTTGVTGFSLPDAQSNWTGLDVDVCRALAAALFGDARAVKFTPLSSEQRFTALQSGEVDILARNTTWTLTRDTQNGLNFAPPVFYDGQGFMVAKALGVTRAVDLAGASVCMQPGTTTELNAADFFRSHGIAFHPVVIEAFSEVNAAFFAGRCDVYTADASGLAAIRARSAPNPDDYVILPERISKEPLAPAVRHGDDQWFDLVSWTVYALIQAEEFGITADTVDRFVAAGDPNIQRFLGVTPGLGQALGVDDRWAYRIVKQVGNYGEVFTRNVGAGSPLNLPRGLNALWTDGGLMYAPPFR